jgi:hypothetical protein
VRYAEGPRHETVSPDRALFQDEAARDIVLQAPNHYKSRTEPALRSPARPNPIAHSVVRLLSVEGRTSVIGLDCRDGAPLVDISPTASIDAARRDRGMARSGADVTARSITSSGPAHRRGYCVAATVTG